MTFDALLEEARKLPTADRLRLADELRHTATADGADDDLSPEQLAELERRLDRLDREGSRGMPWDQFRRELLGGAGR